MLGECLCGAVAFELRGEIPKLYQCHCSLCRKVSGAASNAAIIVDRDQLQWLRGWERVQKFATATGFKSHFCAVCGSPVPNPTRDDSAWWVPLGLTDGAIETEIGAQLYIASRAAWDVIADAGERFDEMPDAERLDRLLRRSKSVS